MNMELEPCIVIHILLHYIYGGIWCWNAGRCFKCIWNWGLTYQSTSFFAYMVEFGAGMLAGVFNVYGTGALRSNPHASSLPLWWKLVLEC